MSDRELSRVRRIALALPEVNERVSHGEPCFFVRDRKPLCYFHDDHNGDGRVSIWCPVPPDVQAELVSANPERFFRPAPSASGTFSGWLGAYVDGTGNNQDDWREIGEILDEAFRYIAPKGLLSELDPS